MLIEFNRFEKLLLKFEFETYPFVVIVKEDSKIKVKNNFMYSTYHLQSAEDINPDIVAAIKAAFKSKPIKITIEEDKDETAFLLSNPANKTMLTASIEQDKNNESVTVNIAG